MFYEMLAPSTSLAAFIDCFWILAAPKSVADPEIVLPDGKTELIVHFGDDFEKLEAGVYHRQARVLLSGQITERILLRPTGEIGVVAARFKPAGAARFFDLDYGSIVDQVIDFATHDPMLAKKLHDDVARCTSHAARLSILKTRLEELLVVELVDDVFVRQACEYIVQSEGRYTVQELVKLIGFSERQLVRKFKKNVGLAPKALLRIMRFQKFIATTKASPNLTLADAALACDYYDQSHFIRDFTRFAGVSPQHYLQSTHQMSDALTTPVAKK